MESWERAVDIDHNGDEFNRSEFPGCVFSALFSEMSNAYTSLAVPQRSANTHTHTYCFKGFYKISKLPFYIQHLFSHSMCVFWASTANLGNRLYVLSRQNDYHYCIFLPHHEALKAACQHFSFFNIFWGLWC